MKRFLFNQWQRVLWIMLVLGLPFVILYILFEKVFKCPACYLFADQGDGLKNYFTLAYYVQHDKGWHFSGMNYPYGEHIIYTDNQPILAILLQWLDRHIIDMDHHVVGTVNMLMIMSMYVAVLVIYVLLRRWSVGRWWALGSSLCITFLSPQIMRIGGHYALAYICFLPLLVLLIDLLVRKSKMRWLWASAVSLWIILMSLTHMYFLLLSLGLLTAFTFFWWLYHRRQREFISGVLPWLLLTIILPVVVLLSIRKFTDHVVDRPVEPWGINDHLVRFETTFFPFIPPFDKTYTTIFKIDQPNSEKLMYTGLMGLIMIPAFLFFVFRKRDEDFLNQHIKTFAATALVAWLMAAGVFYQNGFKFMWEVIPLMKQFRGLGRFGYVFYYLYMPVCSYLLWRLYLLLKEKDLARVGQYILAFTILIWAFEAKFNAEFYQAGIYRQNKAIANDKNDYVPLLTAAGKKPEDFQAILQLPLVAIGNETMGVTRGLWTLREGIHVSMETGLPLIDYSMSRTSVSQGMDIVELISTPYSPKRRAAFFDERPLLLVTEEEFVIPAERKWVDKAEKIGTYQSITLYSLPSEVFKNPSLPFIPSRDSLPKCSGWFNGFDDHKSDTVMSGDGALFINKAPYSIWQYTDNSPVPRNWEVSFWSRIDNRKKHVPLPRMMETDTTGKAIQNSGIHRENILWAEAYGDWIQASFPLTTQGNGFKYELFIDLPGPVIDNLLIRELNDTCIIITPQMFLYNNLPTPSRK